MNKVAEVIVYVVALGLAIFLGVVVGKLAAETYTDYKESEARTAQYFSPASKGVIVEVGSGLASNVTHLEKLIEDRQRSLGIIE